jgi:hypothetical protein
MIVRAATPSIDATSPLFVDELRQRARINNEAWPMILAGYRVTSPMDLNRAQTKHLIEVLSARVRLNGSARLPRECHKGDASRE